MISEVTTFKGYKSKIEINTLCEVWKTNSPLCNDNLIVYIMGINNVVKCKLKYLGRGSSAKLLVYVKYNKKPLQLRLTFDLISDYCALIDFVSGEINDLE